MTTTAPAQLARTTTGRTVDLSPLRTLLARIEVGYHPLQVWLFGSRARNEATTGSDWDLLVVLPEDSPEDMLDPLYAWRIQKNSGVYADVIPCRYDEFLENLDTVNTLPYVVSREGLLIHER